MDYGAIVFLLQIKFEVLNSTSGESLEMGSEK